MRPVVACCKLIVCMKLRRGIHHLFGSVAAAKAKKVCIIWLLNIYVQKKSGWKHHTFETNLLLKYEFIENSLLVLLEADQIITIIVSTQHVQAPLSDAWAARVAVRMPIMSSGTSHTGRCFTTAFKFKTCNCLCCAGDGMVERSGGVGVFISCKVQG